MARPIPTNPAGLQPRPYAVTRPAVAGRVRPRPAPPPAGPAFARARAARGVGQAQPHRQLLWLVSVLTGGLALASALDLCPPLAASELGLDGRGAFYLLVAGAYLLASALYGGWRTRLLVELDGAPWDARLMVYASLAVGGVVSVALALLAVAAVAVVALVVAVLALMLCTSGER